MTDVTLWVYYRAAHGESIEQRHAEVVAGMARVGPPFGFSGANLPPSPDCGSGLNAVYGVDYAAEGLKFVGTYKYRGETFKYKDKSRFDDTLQIGFDSEDVDIKYRDVLWKHFPTVIEAFRGYRAICSLGLYSLFHLRDAERSDDNYKAICGDKSIDVNGRNNIYTLHPAQYWDSLLCNLALGYGPEEVVARLDGDALMVRKIGDGVYVLLNDDPNLTYESFLDMNKKFKAKLGIA